MENKKVFIVHASAGSGHKKAAEAILSQLKSRDDAGELMDITDDLPVLFKWFYTKGYLILIVHFAAIWGLLYALTDTPVLSLLNNHLRRFCNSLMCRRFIKRIILEKPDVLISTHFLASEVVSYAKIKFNLKIRLMTVITDFGVHNFWIAPQTDVYCCAGEQTRRILISKGINDKNIAVTGIPLHPNFTKYLNREELVCELNLKTSIFTALIVTGGIGAGPIEEIVESLKDEDIQLLVVCGRNKGLYERLFEKKYPNVYLFGFVDFIEKLMKVADVIITKAGGLSVTESLNMSLPMIFFFLLPGQETINAQTMQVSQTGVIAHSLEEIKQLVLRFKDDAKYRLYFKNNTLLLAKPDACRDIISLIDK